MTFETQQLIQLSFVEILWTATLMLKMHDIYIQLLLETQKTKQRFNMHHIKNSIKCNMQWLNLDDWMSLIKNLLKNLCSNLKSFETYALLF